MPYDNVIVDVQGGKGTIRINRPKVLNALNAATLDDLFAAAKELNDNADARVIIVTGEGDKAFVAGADIAAMRSMTPIEAMAFSQKGHMVMSFLEEMGKPVIAAVNGYALGGGFELALACDIIYASEKAKVGFPEVTLGIFPGFGGTQRTAKLAGLSRAKELIFTGRVISAREAYEMDLLNKVVPDGQLMEAVDSLAASMLAAGPIGIGLAKACANKSLSMDIGSGLDFEAKSFGLCFGTSDQKEGMTAFLEKRKPTYRGQ